ncbi:5'-nucleotidase C-terminal domain-containing protein [Cryobacterium serini]|uniref:Bifunctional metallophosphatase/5'-nucleotidase n=1 Tax=Cryobacterium serini TaxID=1259201 RepID=A0A4R9BNT6_9MICO|nr:5'-nucleotidase C-terminal domain-containing protein [Cryobacterium serini]TFD87910.1 bifunctional metallophosphatase/5'-nucleotidase [Cryobacterium serini]
MITAGAVLSPDSSTHRTRRRARSTLAAVIVLAFGFSTPATAPVSAAEPPIIIDVLTINDFHGRIEAAGAAAGAAVLAGAVNQFRDAGNTLVVSAGDNIGASTFTSFIQQDTPTIDALNAIGLDASALGNHEFDQGRADLDDRVIPAADFPYLSANVYDLGTGQPAFEQYVVTEVDGISVGFIGAVTNQLPSLVSPAGISTLEVRDVVTEVNRVAANLGDGDAANGEADVTILLVHEGAAGPDLADSTDDSAFGRIVTDTDPSVAAIVSAHTHQLYSHSISVAGNSLPRPVIQAASYGQDLGHLSLAVDPESHELVSIAGETLPTVDADGVALYPADPAVASLVTAATEAAAPLGAVIIGVITNDFNRARQSDGTENRGGESILGNFVADVQLSATIESGAQIALMNPGGLRTDLVMASSGPDDLVGDVSYREAASVQPFANTLVTMDLTGTQLRQVLEEQWQPTGSSRPFLKLGLSKSLAYTYDPTAAAGEHITHMFFNGVEIADSAVHRITVNSFLAAGGDNFFTLASGTNQADSGQTDLQAMVDYFVDTRVANPDQSQRAIGVTLTPPVEDAYLPGQNLEIGLSSLLMSAGEGGSDIVFVQFDGAGATYLIDPAIVDNTDEVGRANVLFPIPSDASSGLHQVTFEVVGTGTAITIPIVIKDVGPVAVQTTTTAAVQRHFVSQKRAVQLRVEVAAADKATPTGTIRVFDRGELIKTRLLTSQKDGVVTTGITGLSRGVHKLTVQYSGSDHFQESVSRPIRVVVY